MSKATVHPNDNGPEPSAGLSFSQVIAAGLASAGAAVLTSRFGVTGTLLGAALTTMIITGGSAVLKNYLEKMSGHVQNIGTRTSNRIPKATRSDSPPVSHRTSDGMAVYGRRRNPFGSLKRRSVFVGALIPALLAFGIAITAVTGVELTGGRTLSCLVWDEGCQTASADGTSENSSTSLGRLTESSDANSSDVIQRRAIDGDTQNSQQTPSQSIDQNSGIFGNGNDNPNAGSSDGVTPVIPDGSANDSDSAAGSSSDGSTPSTGTNGGTPSTDDTDTGTAPVEEVPDYETPSTGTSGGTEEQAPTETPSSSSRSSDSGVTPSTSTE